MNDLRTNKVEVRAMSDRFLSCDINVSLRDLVPHYRTIKLKFKYKEISSITSSHHNRRLTSNMLKQISKLKILTLRKNVTENQLHHIFVNKLGTSLHTLGYRHMADNVYIKYNINVSKEDV